MQPWRQDGNMAAEISALRAKYLKILKTTLEGCFEPYEKGDIQGELSIEINT